MEAYGWKAAPQYVVRDRDAVYGDIFIRRVRAMGIPVAAHTHHLEDRGATAGGRCEEARAQRVSLRCQVFLGTPASTHRLRICVMAVTSLGCRIL